MQTPYRLTGATTLLFGRKTLPETYLLIIKDRDVQFQMLANLSSMKKRHAMLYISEHPVTPVHVRCGQPFDVDYILFDEHKEAFSYGWLPACEPANAVYIRSFSAKYILFFRAGEYRELYEKAKADNESIRISNLQTYQLSGINIQEY
jgi:hypothetical protein